MSILDREAKIFRFLFESAVFEREFAAEALSTTVNFQRFKMTPFYGEGPVRAGLCDCGHKQMCYQQEESPRVRHAASPLSGTEAALA